MGKERERAWGELPPQPICLVEPSPALPGASQPTADSGHPKKGWQEGEEGWERVGGRYLLSGGDGDPPDAVHVGRVSIREFRGREVALAVLERLPTGCEGRKWGFRALGETPSSGNGIAAFTPSPSALLPPKFSAPRTKQFLISAIPSPSWSGSRLRGASPRPGPGPGALSPPRAVPRARLSGQVLQPHLEPAQRCHLGATRDRDTRRELCRGFRGTKPLSPSPASRSGRGGLDMKAKRCKNGPLETWARCLALQWKQKKGKL